ncbi:MAG: hypothetical protein ACK55I_41920, partial [bacterium]
MAAKKALWKNFLLSNPDFKVSNNYLAKIKDFASQSHPFTSMFDGISKNHGSAMISLDPTESSIRLFHHNQVIGGNWENPSKLFVSICGFDHSACPVQIAKKSVKSIKAKVPSFVEVMDRAILESLGEDTKTSQKVEYHSTNIIPIPHILTKTYLSLTDFTPASVAKAFY